MTATPTKPPRLPKGRKLTAYYVAAGQWFVVRCRNKKRARTLGVDEFGRGNVSEVRPATKEECAEYVRWKSLDAVPTDPEL
jgi:hypothetical protein